MQPFPIVQIGHPALRRVAQPLPLPDILTPEIQEVIDRLIVTMRESPIPSIGIAASQVALDLRIILARLSPDPRARVEDGPLCVICNPIITRLADQQVAGWEGCLSIAGLRGIVKRSAYIHLEGQDRAGEPICFDLRGYSARIAQHEIDHLDGILYLDRIYEQRDESPVITTSENYEQFFQKHPACR